MSGRTSSRLAVGLWAGLLAITASGAVLQILTRHAHIGSSFAFRGVDIILQGGIGTVGVLIATRRRENPIGWLLLGSSFGGAWAYLETQYVVLSIQNHRGSLPLTPQLAWMQNWLWIPVTGSSGSIASHSSPTVEPSPRDGADS